MAVEVEVELLSVAEVIFFLWCFLGVVVVVSVVLWLVVDCVVAGACANITAALKSEEINNFFMCSSLYLGSSPESIVGYLAPLYDSRKALLLHPIRGVPN